jgi:adenylate kinase family enzyme
MPHETSGRRVRVVGNSGAGKTTLARRIAAVRGVPRRELDEVFFTTDWQRRDADEALADLRAWTDGPGADGWVIDGNWTSHVGYLFDDADLVVWLDYPRWVVMPRIMWRALSRWTTRRELWHGNRESLTNMLSRDPTRNIVLWSWTQHSKYHTQYAALAAADPRWLRLPNPRAARGWWW